jgi:hypothetical protein
VAVVISWDDPHSLRLKATGVLTGAELVEANRAFFATELDQFADAATWLSDYTDCTVGDFPSELVRDLVEISVRVSRVNPRLRVALAVTPDLLFGIGRMWESLAAQTGWEAGVFRSLAEAERWLGRGSADA